jgi:hypothetical protein
MGVIAPRRMQSVLRRALSRSFAKTDSLVSCPTIDQSRYECLRADAWLAIRVTSLADPVDTSESIGPSEARLRLGIAANAVMALAYGNLTLLKGMQYLLLTFRALPREDLHVLAVGMPNVDFRTVLNGSHSRALVQACWIHMIHRWAARATQAAFVAVDLVWLGYVGHFQASAVRIQAGRAGVPTSACEAGLIGWNANRCQCGPVVPVQHRESLAAAFDALTASPRDMRTWAKLEVRPSPCIRQTKRAPAFPTRFGVR